jgi:hypothetical protein
LTVQEGPPDASAVAAWHLALSNLIGVEVAHDLLALWLFPERGGMTLLAPLELAQDRVELGQPDPFLSQHQIYGLEERIRHAGYQSVVAVPVRSPARDLGLALFAHLEAGRYGVPQAMHLHAVVHQLLPTFESLALAPPHFAASGTGGPLTAATAPEAVARACAEGRTGAEVLRLLSGTLLGVVPHERLEIVVPGSAHGLWALLSGAPEGRRWGESTAAVSQAVAGLVAQAGDDDTLLVEDLREGPGLAWPSYRDLRTRQRVRSVLGIRLAAAGVEDAWLLVGGPAPGMFMEADREVLSAVAPVVALRVQGLRAQLEADVTRAQAQTVQATQARAGRLAAALAATAHWGDAVALFVKEVRESLGYAQVRFALRLGDDRYVECEPGDLRPLTSLPQHPLDSSDLSLVLSGLASFLVSGASGADLAVPLRVAGRVIGALELLGGKPGSTGHPVTAAQLLADLLAPHLELLRRAAIVSPLARPRREVLTGEV